MAIVVNSIKHPYKIIFQHEEEKVEITFRQLNFKVRSIIGGLITGFKNGRVTIDSSLAAFYNLKYGITQITGLLDEDGEEYKLRFETEEKLALADDCVDELLTVPFSDKIIYSARTMIEGIPSLVTNPLTGEPLEGVEIVRHEKGEVLEKK